jgi:hypothetical protein
LIRQVFIHLLEWWHAASTQPLPLTKTSTIEGEPGMTAKLTAKPAIDSEQWRTTANTTTAFEHEENIGEQR